MGKDSDAKAAENALIEAQIRAVNSRVDDEIKAHQRNEAPSYSGWVEQQAY